MDDGSAELTYEEVWDDSALIDSWNEALAEYKKYHSIHAKGGTIKDLKNEEEATPRATRPSAKDGHGASDSETTMQTDSQMESQKQPDASEAAVTGTASQPAGPPGPPPQALLGSIQDESLKKLLMAWYYAGYYTGLFEGQRQSQ